MIFLPNSILSGRHCLTLRFYTRLAEFSILIFPGSVAIMSLPTEKTNTDRYRSGYNGPDSKSGVPARVPWVRIPPCPPKGKGRPKGVLFLLAWHSQGGIRTGRRRSRSQQSGGLLASPRENPFFRFGKAPVGRNSNRAAAKPQKHAGGMFLARGRILLSCLGKASEGRNSNRAAAKPQPTVRWTVG